MWSAITLAFAIAAMVVLRGTATFTPDSVIYGRMMLADSNMPPAESTSLLRTFFTKQFSPDEFLLKLIGPDPPQFFRDQYPLFKPRPVYPYLASLAYPRFGFSALPLISRIAYVLLTIMLFWLLLSFGPPRVAVIITLCAVLIPLSYPTVLDLGTYGLTDSLALLLFIMTLLAQVRYTMSGAAAWLVPYALSAALLALTRPAVYLVLGAALAVFLFGLVHKSRSFTLRGSVLSLIAVAVVLCYLRYASSIHAPGLAGQMMYYYELHLARGHHKDLSFGVWYLLELLRTIIYEVRDIVLRPIELVTTIGGIYGLSIGRRRPEIVCVIGAMLSLVVAVITHPVPDDQGRTIEVPLVPFLAIGVITAISTRKLFRER